MVGLKVLDFGLAKALTGDVAQTDPGNSPTMTMRATMAGVIMGTAAYMSPEQARGQAVDKRADIWSFGVVVYELLTGNQLFGGETVSDTLAGVLKTDPDLSVVPSRFQRLLRLCLTRDPHQRLRDISGARLLLEPAPAAAAPVPARGGARWWMAGCAVLAIALAVVSARHLSESAPQPESVRFQVFPPEGGSFDRPWVALSPDGRKLVFSAMAKGSSRGLLWVRTMDSLEAHSLPGTENALFPFWSPDSRSVGYWNNNAVYRVEMAGGPPRLVTKAAVLAVGGSGSGTWSTDGNIYFAAGYSGIYRVSQTGGEPVSIVRPDNSRGEVSYFFPLVLPDGRGILFQNQTSVAEHFALDRSSLDGKNRSRIANSRFNVAYAPPARAGDPAHLVILRQSTLFAVPVDAGTLAPKGEEFAVAEHVGSSITYGAFSVAASRTLAFLSGGYAAHRQLTWYDRSGHTVSNLGPPADYDILALSPDEKRVITTRDDSQNNLQNLTLVDARGVSMGLTSESDVRDAVWSPDGTQVAISMRTKGPPQVFIKNADGSGQPLLVEKGDGTERPCDWSSDGRLLMITRNKADRNEIWTISDPADAARRKAELYLSGPEPFGQCRFSPGPGVPKWVVYASPGAASGDEVYAQAFPGGGGKVQISDHGGAQPRWRADGKELFYLAPDGKLMAVDIKMGPTLEAGIPHALFDSHAWGPNHGARYAYDVSRDGTRFLVLNPVAADSVAGSPSITVVTDWLAAAKRPAP